MTAEVIVMNKEAAALAADSAVTFAGSKIFTTAEKLFMLAPGHAVGVMVFNSAEFMGLSWNIIIKLYRDILSGQNQFDSLQEYAEQFLSFLTIHGDSIFPETQQAAFFTDTIDMIMNEIMIRFWQEINRRYFKGDEIDDEVITEVLSEAIDHFYQFHAGLANRYSDDENLSVTECLLDKYRDAIENRRNALFENLPLTDEDKRKIQELCLFLFTKNSTLRYFTGVAFVGYGAKDLFPAFIMFSVENFQCGKLKSKLESKTMIDFRTGATIIPLAQDDISVSILSGVHPIYQSHLREHLSSCLQADILEEVLEQTAKSVREEYTNSIMRSVAALPKGDLAVIAETLVGTTSFMRKHSMDMETVGGPIDVAVISKKDGFVWIKRKHYFDMGYNQHFLNR